MKKTVIVLTSILAVIWAGLSIFSSSGEYEAERLFYRAMKINSNIAKNPDVAPPALLESVEKGLLRLIEKYPKAEITRTGSIALAEFYLKHKRYDEALSMVKSISEKYRKDPPIMAMARFIKGAVYEKMGRWDDALAEFRILRERYPYTQIGMESPVYIIRHYAAAGDRAALKRSYSEAAAFYKRLRKKYRNTNLGYTASVYLLRTQLNAGNYEEAGEALEYALNTYQSSGLLRYVEPIFVKRLNRPEKAAAIYNSVLKRTTDAGLTKIIKDRLNKLSSNK